MTTLGTAPVAARVPAPAAERVSTTVIRAQNLAISYGNVRALDAVDLDLMASQLVAVVGRNGAGKSSLLRALAGAGVPDAGEVSWLASAATGRRATVAYIPQRATPRWEFPITVGQAVACARIQPGRWWRRPGAADRRAIDAALDVLELRELRERAVGSLSGGQAQRLLLARALAQDPDVMLLDEPFEGLDAGTTAILLAALRRAADRGVAVCCSLHQLHLARDHFDRVIALDRRVVADGPARVVLSAHGVMTLFGLAERG